MTTTVHRLDPEVVTAFRTGDEHALERVFYSKFPMLLELVRAEVPDAARATKVVENVLLRAWQDRQQMENPLTMDSFLERVAHEAAIREKGRLAGLHRHDTPGAAKERAKHVVQPPTIDEAWAQVKEALHASNPAHDQLLKESRSLSKHHAASHMAAVGTPKRFPVLFFGGAIAVSLAVLAVLFWIPASKESGKITRALASNDTRDVATKAGQRGNIKLDDGTTVALGADSHLLIPPVFPSTLRVVGLNGSAIFTVAAGQSLPFMVRTGTATIRATGTVFAVSAYPTDKTVTVRVREGSVLLTGINKDATVNAGSTVVVSESGDVTPATPSQLAEALGWIDGTFEVTDQPIETVLPLFKRWYQMDVSVADKELLNRKVSMKAGLDSAKAAMTALESNGSVVFDFDGKKWLLRDVEK